MLEVLNRYSHGLAALPLLDALKRRGVLDEMQASRRFDTAALIARHGANPGYLQVALRLLTCLEWIQPEGDGAFGVRDELGEYRFIPADISTLIGFPFDIYVRDPQAHSLGRWVDASRDRWGCAGAALADYLDGVLILPLLLALRDAHGFRVAPPVAGEGTAGPVLHILAPEPVVQQVGRLFLMKNWCVLSGDVLQLTRAGEFILERCFITAALASYRAMLARSDELLFGNFAHVFSTGADGQETHVERTLNVRGSGFQHQKYFAALIEIVLPLFQGTDFVSQPHYLADTGCGDGSLLRSVYEAIRARTPRGAVLDSHPLTLLGIDFHAKALEATSATLAGLPHRVLRGDIGDPAQLLADLREIGIADPQHILHLRSFLDHDRPYAAPAAPASPPPRALFADDQVHLARDGGRIGAEEMRRSTTEHLRRWAGVVSSHGLVVLEVHALSAAATARFVDTSESLHFDLYHALSRQYLISARTFVACAAEAGLFCRRASARRFPERLPYTRISLCHFQPRPFEIVATDAQQWQAALAGLPELWRGIAGAGTPTEAEGCFVVRSGATLRAAAHWRRSGPAGQPTLTVVQAAVPADDEAVELLLDFLDLHFAWGDDGAELEGLADCAVALSASAKVALPTTAHGVAERIGASLPFRAFAPGDDPRAAEEELGAFAVDWVLAGWRRDGVLLPGEPVTRSTVAARLALAPKYQRYFEALLRRLEHLGHIRSDARHIELLPTAPSTELRTEATDLDAFGAAFSRRHPHAVGALRFVLRCLPRYRDILAGRVDVAEVLLDGEGLAVFGRLFSDSPAADFLNAMTADALVQAVRLRSERLPPDQPVRILEIGAGTGATTAALLAALADAAVPFDFLFTDLSLTFVRHARQRFQARYPAVRYQALDIDSPCEAQEIAAHSVDVVVAANVLHDTADVVHTLRQVRRLLKSDGVLVANEFTAARDYLLFSGMLLHGAWLFADPQRRLPDSCLLDPAQWHRAMAAANLTGVAAFGLPGEGCDSRQTVFVAAASGPCDVVAELVPPAAAPVPIHVPAAATAREFIEAQVGALIREDLLGILDERRASAYAPTRPVMEMGLDSMELVELKTLLAQRFAVKLPTAFLFEYETQHKMARFFGGSLQPDQLQQAGIATVLPALPDTPLPQPAGDAAGDRLAIVGLSCRLPGGADTPQAFWQLLEDGRSGVVTLPHGRWCWPDHIDLGGRHAGLDKGGFLSGIDEFDARLFRVSPKEAAMMDPQQRLLLELSWSALEDAGYRASALTGSQTGVFIGACHNDYRDVLAGTADGGDVYAGSGGALSMLANRISYYFDFKGPSVTVDTACSSSLTALHYAAAAIRDGHCAQALVGAANLLCSSFASIAYHSAGMLSPTGACRVFDETADGYVRGEGGVVVLIKPLADAVRDGDAIYGLLAATALSHGGQAASLTSPRPDAQAQAIEQACRHAGVAPHTIGYLEAHGTGTRLGDPIEITGMTEAFRRLYQAEGKEWPAQPHCAIGSVKSNLGHLEGAAGLAGVAKVLLAMKRRTIPRTLNFSTLNRHIELQDTPFLVAAQNRPWLRARDAAGGELPLRAGVSSFGFGGANAHALIEEYRAPEDARPASTHGQRVVLSAASPAQLSVCASQLAEWIGQRPVGTRIDDVAHTLRVGREALPHRRAFTADDFDQLEIALRRYAADPDAEPRTPVDAAAGDDGEAPPFTPCRRVHLPTYPFDRQRYWVQRERGAAPALHPLLQRNTSTLQEQRFSSRLAAADPLFVQHLVCGARVLPGTAYLEIGRAAVEHALGRGPLDASTLVLHDMVWLRPLQAAATDVDIDVAVVPQGPAEFRFVLRTAEPGGTAVVCAQGSARLQQESAAPVVDLAYLRSRCAVQQPTAHDCYERFLRAGIDYGPRFRLLQELHLGVDCALARLAPADVAAEAFELPPECLDAAWQTALALQLYGAAAPDGDAPLLPFELGSLIRYRSCAHACFAVVLRGDGTADGVVRYDIDLVDDDGQVCVRMRGLCLRRLGDAPAQRPAAKAAPAILLERRWTDSAVRRGNLATEAERVVVLLGTATAYAGPLRVAGLDRIHAIAGAQPDAGGTDAAEFYVDRALQVFETLRLLLADAPSSPRLVQLVVAADPLQRLAQGLGGLVRSVRREHPAFRGQVIVLETPPEPAELAAMLHACAARPGEDEIRCQDGRLLVPEWIAAAESAPVSPWRDGSVYVISGGAGGIGALLGDEIASRTRGASVILLGRSPATSPSVVARLAALRAGGVRGDYHAVDLACSDAVDAALQAIRRDYGRIDGIVHAAGVIDDAYLLHKSTSSFRAVLQPKVAGLVNLDRASSGFDLDFFLLFSSLSSVLGNVGQADYAAANGFLDAYAAHRGERVSRGECHGRTLSLNWPLWAEGGMRVDDAGLQQLRRQWGMVPLPRPAAMDALARALSGRAVQVAIGYGERDALLHALAGLDGSLPVRAAVRPNTRLAAALEDDLGRLIADFLHVRVSDIEPDQEFGEFGLDSVGMTGFINSVNDDYGLDYAPTLLLEFSTLRKLSAHLAATQQAVLAPRFGIAGDGAPASPAQAAPHDPIPVAARFAPPPPAAATAADAVAVIGMSGRFPLARDVDVFWNNLLEGRSGIVEIPPERWDWRELAGAAQPEGSRTDIRWGGFIEGVDEFDPRFFTIAPREAESMDPQQRLLLCHAWNAIEDAGYAAGALAGSDTGVFVGMGLSDYGSVLRRAGIPIEAYSATGSVASVGPNRLSYLLDLRGPSEPIETACSSALVAIHRAMQAIRAGDCGMAIAGGVNTLLTPDLHISFSKAGMLSPEGRCYTFSDRANGYVRGEGIGVLLLRRARDAEAAGDPIYALLRSSALNHGGRSNTLTAPNPQAQAALLEQAYAAAGVDPADVSYIETHGTGTALGDPIEIDGLQRAFKSLHDARGQSAAVATCGLGSVKSNIGHLELAAGVAGVIKVLLQLKHSTLVASLNCETLNPYIRLQDSPFFIVRQNQPWPARFDADGRRRPRVAGVSSFGFGGVNAHVVIEEYLSAPDAAAVAGPVLIVLSAKDDARLRARAQDLLAILLRSENRAILLADLAFTLQVGREAMDERLAFPAASLADVSDALTSFLDTRLRPPPALRRGRADTKAPALELLAGSDEMVEVIARWVNERRLDKLADLWIRGYPLDWAHMYRGERRRRLHLPGYAFARERCWPAAALPSPAKPAGQGLLHAAQAEVLGRRFDVSFDGSEFFLRGHVLGDVPTLPAVAYLELVRDSLQRALAETPRVDGTPAAIRLQNLVWLRPFQLPDRPRVLRLQLSAAPDLQFEFSSEPTPGGARLVHAQGQAEIGKATAMSVLDIGALRQRCGQAHVSATRCYEAFAAFQFHYGTDHQAIAEMHVGNGELLARLVLPPALRDGAGAFVLHPALADAAVQATIGFTLLEPGASPGVPFELRSAEILCACSSEMFVHVKRVAGSDAMPVFDIDLSDESGRICARLRGLATRPASALLSPDGTVAAYRQVPAGESLLAPAWQAVRASPNDPPDPLPRGKALLLGDAPALSAFLHGTGTEIVALQLDPTADDVHWRDAIVAHGDFDQIVWALPQASQRPVDPAIASPDDAIVYAYRLVKALLSAVRDSSNLTWTVLTQGARQVGEGRAGDPGQAGLHGFLATMAREFPDWRVRIVDLDAGSAPPPAGELFAWPHRAVAQIRAWRDGAWYEQVLRPARDTGAHPVPYREGGVYVVIGGAGGLSEVWSERLVRDYRAQLVWIGRRPEDDAIRARIQRLAAIGPAPLYIAADAADRTQLQTSSVEVKRRFGRIDGVVQAAAVLRDHSLSTLSMDDLRAALKPKVDASIAVVDVFGAEPLDFLLFFSSFNAFVHAPGQSNYVAGCVFQDEYARRLAAGGDRRVRVINWGYWGRHGIAATDEHRQRMAQAGFGSIEAPQARQALDILLAGPQVQLACVKLLRPLALDQPLGSAAAHVAAPTASGENDLAGLLRQPRPQAMAQLRQVLRRFVALTLGLAPDALDSPQRNFADALLGEFGVDSLMATTLRSKLRGEFAVDLPVHALIGERVEALVERIYEQLQLQQISAARPDADDANMESFVF